MRGFANIETWVFDLDNTLYSPSCRLFDQMDVKMGTFIAERFGVCYDEAKVMQKGFFLKYGTTLRGLMLEHAIAPGDFLDFVHDIDHSVVPANPLLDVALHKLPGRKLIFTNGTVSHAERVLARIGVAHHFADIFDIVHSDYVPKPSAEPYRKFIAKTGIEARASAMFEDIARNLEAPHDLGMTTVLVTSSENVDGNRINGITGTEHAYVHHRTDDLAGFLTSCLIHSFGQWPSGQSRAM
jgi:putative hydrolase of the HAD superfamily